MSDALPRVVVVGAGLAGLRCADLLAGRVDLVVLEAQDRVGGRCWSSRGWSADQVGEHGGELIEDGQDHLMRLVAELGLSLEPRQRGPRVGRMTLAGKVRDPAEVRGLGEVFERLDADLRAVGPVDFRVASRRLHELDEMTAEDWISTNVDGGLGSDLGACVALGLALNLGFEARKLSAVALHHMWLGLPEPDAASSGFRFGHDAGPGSDDPQELADVLRASVLDVYHVAGGNDQIPAALASRLPSGSLRLASEVTAVVQEPDGRYRVSIADQPAIQGADRVVLTAPMPVLHAMDLSGAGLSERRHRALAEIPMGTGTKLTLQLDLPPSRHPGWPGFALVDHPAVALWDSSRGQPGDAGLLTMFTSERVFRSADGAHAAPDEASLQQARRLLDQVVPGLHERCTGTAWLDSWPDDEWARGSYAGFAPGQYARYAGFLSLPEAGVHFAGEHTSLASPGYLDGAVASGERAAGEVLKALGLEDVPGTQ